MAFSCAKISRSWITFHRTFASHSRSGIKENRPHSSTTTAAAQSFPDFEDSDGGQNRKKGNKTRHAQDSQINGTSAETKPSSKTFDDFVAHQIRVARRSLLVRFAVRSPQLYDDAYQEICRQLRSFDVTIVPNSRMVHSPDGQKTFFLLETTSVESLHRFVQSAARSAVADERFLPCRSRILHFTADFDGNSGSSASRTSKLIPGTDELTLNKALRKCLTVDDQMRVLVEETMLTESGTRLRFFVASLVEDTFRGVFPLSICTPFGSSSNGFGDANSDLDMDFSPEDSSAANTVRSNWLCAFRVRDEDSRKHTQSMVELFGRMIRYCMPYCVDVSRISHARVPIVKFRHEAGGFSCDLTTENMTGAAFAKILWMYSQYDDRMRPLVFTVRRWAAALKLTRDTPGVWLTNFQLLCLVIYFLQSRSPSSTGQQLPPIRTLRLLASSQEKYGIVGDPDYLASRLVRNDRLRSRSPQSDSRTKKEPLSDLLREFFHFYGHLFAFDRLGISLENGTVFEKTDLSQPLFIDNPLEADHNVAKNVVDKELCQFRSCARKALKIMETKELMEAASSSQDSWGLLALWNPSLYDKMDDVSSVQQQGVLLVDDVKIDI